MKISLDPPVSPGTTHRFQVRSSGSTPEVIDYVGDGLVHLHVSIRPDQGTVVLNDRTGAGWNEKVVLRPSTLPSPLPVELRFGMAEVTLAARDATITVSSRSGRVSEAAELRTSAGVRLLATEGPAAPPAAVTLRPAGAVDRCTEALVRGWAADLADPSRPVRVEVLVGEVRVGSTLANLARLDLAEVAPALATTGFLFRFARMPPSVAKGDLAVSVRFEGGGPELLHSPWPIRRSVPAGGRHLRPAGSDRDG